MVGSRIYSLSEAMTLFIVDTVFIAVTCCPPTIVSGRNSIRQVESASILLRLSAIETGSRLTNCADCCTPIAFVAPKRAGLNGTESAEAWYSWIFSPEKRKWLPLKYAEKPAMGVSLPSIFQSIRYEHGKRTGS